MSSESRLFRKRWLEQRTRTQFEHVFQHCLDVSDFTRIREGLIREAFNCIETNSIGSTRKLMGDHEYNSLKTRIDSLCLYYHDFNLKKDKPECIADVLGWKYSEHSGYMIGCQFWSRRAKERFDQEIERQFHGQATLQDAWNLADCLAKIGFRKEQLNHEHVFPRKDFTGILKNRVSAPSDSRDFVAIQDLFHRLAVACVVLKGEHDQLPSKSDDQNPWRRYGTIPIMIADNPRWPADHRRMIAEAGLLK
jgi:hypothetical protein